MPWDSFVEAVSDSPLTYAVAAGISALDAFFPVVPSETVVIAASALAASGELYIWIIVPAAAVGAFLGDNVSYGLGRWLGDPIADRLFRGDKARARLRWAEDMLRRHGKVIIIVARFIPGGRTATTFASGGLGYPWRAFLVADAIAASAWAIYAAAIGFFGGSAFRENRWLGIAAGLAVAGVLTLAIEGYRRLQAARGRDILGEET